MFRVNGLFGHIQRNNLRTLALFAMFLVLLEAAAYAFMMVPVAISRNMTSMFHGVESHLAAPGKVSADLRQAKATHNSLPSHLIPALPPEPAIAPKSSSVDLNTAMPPIQGVFSAIGSSGETTSDQPAARYGVPFGAAPGVFDSLSKTGDPIIDGVFGSSPAQFVIGVLKRTPIWILVLIGGIVYLANSCWWSAHLMRYETRARPLKRADAPELYSLVENLSITIGLPCPRIEVIESAALNAYAAGFFPTSSTIAVTRGLIQNLTRDELEAVLAHELIHIRDRDVRLMVMARACVDGVNPLNSSYFKSAKDSPFLAFYMALLFLAYLGIAYAIMFALFFAVVVGLAFFVRYAISQTREFTADAGAIELTKNPAAMVMALRKVARSEALPLSGYATRAMMFSSVSDNWFGTHPAIEERINAVMLHGGIGEHDVGDVRAAVRQSVTSRLSNAGPQMAFGRKAGSRLATGSAPSNHRLGGQMIAEPPVMSGVDEPAVRESWLMKSVRIRESIFKAITMPFMWMSYIGAYAAVFGLIMSLMIVNPIAGLCVFAVVVWYGYKRFVSFASRLLRRYADA